MRKLAVAIVFVWCGAWAAAQQPSFRTGVEVVTVPVTVTSLDRNTYIAGLTPADFKVSENGERQDITVVTRERVPVSIVFAVDSSPVMAIGLRRQLAAEAVNRVVAELKPDDEVSILFIRKKIEERLPWTRVGAIKDLNWGGWNPSGSAGGINAGVAPLNDGMRAALDQIERASNPRRAVLIVSAGFESSSHMSMANLVKTRQQSETAVFGIGLGSSDARVVAAEEPHIMKPSGGVRADSELVRQQDIGAPGSLGPQTLPEFDYLETLVGDSGGVVTRVLSLPEATMVAKNIAAELQNQYLVGYTPKKPFDGKYRKLKIEVTRRGLYVRHRGGYLAIAPTQAP